MQFSFDRFNRYEIPALMLANPNYEQLSMIRHGTNLKGSIRFNAISEMSFSIDTTPETAHYYDKLTKKRLIHMKGFGWWVITSASERDDGTTPGKTVSCASYEAVLTGRPVNIDAGTYKFYDTVAPEKTLLGRIASSLLSWRIGYVSTSLTNKYRTFEMPDMSVYAFLTGEASEAYECIFVFDNEEMTINAYTHADLIRDSGVILRYNTLLKGVEIDETDDDIVTALAVYGSGEFSISNVNPLGTALIYRFDYFKDWMSPGLWSAIEAWQDKIAKRSDEYAQKLTALKTENMTLLTLRSGLAKMLAIKDSAQQVQDVQTPYYLGGSVYNAVSGIKAWINGYGADALCQLILSASAYPAVNFANPPGGIQSYVNSVPADQRGIAQALANIYACERAIVRQNEKIKAQEAATGSIRSELAAIQSALSFPNSFTKAQLIELDKYIFAQTYTNEHCAMLDGMTYEEIQDLAAELLESGEAVLKRLSQPKYTFKLDAVNYLFSKEFETFAQKTKLGYLLNVEIHEGDWTTPILLEVNLNWDNPDDFSMVFGNRFRLQTGEYTWGDLMDDMSKVTSAISGDYSQLIAPIRSGKMDALTALLDSALDTAKNAVLAGNNQSMTMDAHGFLGRKAVLDANGNATGAFEPFQFKMINEVLAFTNDNWTTCITALGKISLGNGNYAYGLAAEAVYGKLLAGNQLTISNADQSFVVDESGATLKNAKFSIETANGLNRIYLDAAQGIMIQRRRNTNADFLDAFYVDTGGNLVMDGKIYAGSGYIGGWAIQQSGLSYGNNALYLGVSSIVAAINGINRNVVFRAGSNFGVGTDGTVYAKDVVIQGGSFNSGNFTNITASGNITANSIVSQCSISSPGIYGGSIESASLKRNSISGGSISGTSVSGVYGSFMRLETDSYGYVSLGGGNCKITYSEIKMGNVVIDSSGLTILGSTNQMRLYMNPPTASGGDQARWVNRGSYYSLGIYTSSLKDKKDIDPIGEEAAAIIDALRPVYFRFKDQAASDNRSVGFIAEETDLVCREITSYDVYGMPHGVQYSNITALLVRDAQRIHARLGAIEAKLALIAS